MKAFACHLEACAYCSQKVKRFEELYESVSRRLANAPVYSDGESSRPHHTSLDVSGGREGQGCAILNPLAGEGRAETTEEFRTATDEIESSQNCEITSTSLPTTGNTTEDRVSPPDPLKRVKRQRWLLVASVSVLFCVLIVGMQMRLREAESNAWLDSVATRAKLLLRCEAQVLMGIMVGPLKKTEYAGQLYDQKNYDKCFQSQRRQGESFRRAIPQDAAPRLAISGPTHARYGAPPTMLGIHMGTMRRFDSKSDKEKRELLLRLRQQLRGPSSHDDHAIKAWSRSEVGQSFKRPRSRLDGARRDGLSRDCIMSRIVTYMQNTNSGDVSIDQELKETWLPFFLLAVEEVEPQSVGFQDQLLPCQVAPDQTAEGSDWDQLLIRISVRETWNRQED